jgi:AcrR family transcriptional regulator
MTDAFSDKIWDAFLDSIIDNQSIESDRKQDRSKRREQEILRAAIRVFAREGISRTKSGDIAAEAGMAVSTIYEYFSDKEEIALAVPLTHLRKFFIEYRDSIKGKVTAYDRLWEYLRLTGDFARRNPEWARVLYLEIWPSVIVKDSPVQAGLNDFVRIIVHLLRQGEARGEWTSGGDHYETAAILTGSMNQIIITWALFRRPSNLTKAAISMADRVMSLLQPGHASLAAD